MIEEKVISMLLEHGKEIGELKDTVATKEDISRISDSLDRLVGLAEKNEQEVTLISHGLSRVEERVSKLEQDADPVLLQ